MRIYTKSGDRGETGLVGGSRTPKDDLRIEAIGALDELNAVIGLAMLNAQTHTKGENAQNIINVDADKTPPLALLTAIQHTLFDIGGEIADPNHTNGLMLGHKPTIQLEQEIDMRELTLPPLKNFILPNGPAFATNLHVARTICRRAERRVIACNRTKKLNPNIITYLNRLSDLLFTLARENMEDNKTKPEQWKKI